jgi:hypothetical protein
MTNDDKMIVMLAFYYNTVASITANVAVLVVVGCVDMLESVV